MICSFKMRALVNFSPNPQSPYTIYPNKIATTSLSFSCLPQPKGIRTQVVAISSSGPQTQETTTSSIPRAYDVEFKTMQGCKLGISRYPDFDYNAEGGFGSGSGSGSGSVDSNEEIMVSFDVSKLYIPPLTYGTTKFLGLPLPPFLRIDIVPETFNGTIDQDSGKVDLAFKAKFLFSMGTIYKAPPLLVTTVLTSEESQGQIRKGRGQRMDKDGKCQLVGVSTVVPIDDFFMNTFLNLPTECLAILNATIALQPKS